MSKKPSHFREVIRTLEALHKAYPTQNVGRHLSMALEDYGNLWGLSDKEMAWALDKYFTELSIDPLASDAEVEKLLKDTDKLFREGFDPYDEEEEDY